MPVRNAVSGTVFERCTVYVGVPDVHLMLHDHHILLRRGPHENYARPSADVLLRSTAASFGSRVIGVLLSGFLSDGTAGLRANERCGGLAIMQESAKALVASMPCNAVRSVDVDHVVQAAEMPTLLVKLVCQPAGRRSSRLQIFASKLQSQRRC